MTPEFATALSVTRQLAFHERIVNQVAAKSVRPEIDSNISELERSVLFIAKNGEMAGKQASKSLAKIFAITEDADIQAMA